MEEYIIPDGWHELSGFCDCLIQINHSQYEDTNALIIQIDGKNYLCYEDPDDGWRSYSEFYETDKECTNTFPPQRVIVKNYDDGNNCGIKIFNQDSELILHAGTEDFNDWYPLAVWEWHPENLPINNNRTV